MTAGFPAPVNVKASECVPLNACAVEFATVTGP
jgi:hypothetical protein